MSRSYTRREMLQMAACGVATTALGGCFGGLHPDSGRRHPNVILILTDDQGVSDVGYNGNPLVRTPVIDALAHEAVRFDQFYAMPVCSPTRACLMTGRYHYRTGVVDTAAGRSMMHPDEVTLAEAFRAAGYATAIYGKWHLGDCYPLRPMDQGFDESLIHRGGMIGQDDDPPGGMSYFNPPLMHNGQMKRYQGYCNDIYTDAALEFIERNRTQPFFMYFSTNLPHHPLTAKHADRTPYDAQGLSDETARFYGMISNIDQNIGRLLAKLQACGQREDTIIVFMGDNGTSSLLIEQDRHETGLRGRKTYVYENGIRVPCFVNWPRRLQPHRVDRIGAAIDIMPTLLDACGLGVPTDVDIDGVSLLPLMTGAAATSQWPDRNLYFQWHRGDQPQRGRNIAVRNQRYKLVQGQGRTPGAISTDDYRFELYDITCDPSEQHDIAAEHPAILAQLKQDCDNWYDRMERQRHWQPPRIILGRNTEDICTLTRQDWRRAESNDGVGHWLVDIPHAGAYRLVLILDKPIPIRRVGTAHLRCGTHCNLQQTIHMEEIDTRFESVRLPKGPAALTAFVQSGDKTIAPRFLTVQRLD